MSTWAASWWDNSCACSRHTGAGPANAEGQTFPVLEVSAAGKAELPQREAVLELLALPTLLLLQALSLQHFPKCSDLIC